MQKVTKDGKLSPSLLKLNYISETQRIEAVMRETILRRFKKKGAVIGISGGVDSGVVAALAVRALGKERVFGLLMPERDSAGETLALSRELVDRLGVQHVLEDISPILEAAGCYRRRDEAIRRVIPEYVAGEKNKLVLSALQENRSYRLFKIVVQHSDGRFAEAPLDLKSYLGIVAATNFKQRTRKMMEYYYADSLNYAVVGTPNRLEYDQGFFVKLGDGAADIKPIAHLYKTQVYQLAEFLELPDGIRNRPPTTDTYSLPQSQEEFYFSLPYDKMDLVLYGKNNGLSPAAIGESIGLSARQVEMVFQDIESKRVAARYLHSPPVLVEAAPPAQGSSGPSAVGGR